MSLKNNKAGLTIHALRIYSIRRQLKIKCKTCIRPKKSRVEDLILGRPSFCIYTEGVLSDRPLPFQDLCIPAYVKPSARINAKNFAGDHEGVEYVIIFGASIAL